MAREKLVSLIEDTLELESGSLKAETKLEDVEAWDSIAVISLIAIVDEHYGKTVSAVDISKFRTVGDILNFVAPN